MYTKELLVNTFLHRYRTLDSAKFNDLSVMANTYFDQVGRDTFRTYACVTPEAIRNYKSYLKSGDS